ncbi:MAG: DNA polymerase domain-containing protein [Myxococcales bacterium]|nr:DNA polymerase domain-containing protein [Myxococcales bacterium]
MAKKEPPIELEVDGETVRVTSPSKVYFPDLSLTKLDLVQYYLAVADGALRGIRRRPLVLKRFVDGIEGDFFFQKRAPKTLPRYVDVVELRYPSGRTAKELIAEHPAALAWMASLGCIDLNPHPVRAEDLEHPDELRIDLDPTPGATWDQVRRVALGVREVLDELGLPSWPKTSGSRGIHVLVRLLPRWSFEELRRAALAVAREVERRMPDDASSKWWKEERHGVFIDFNQNARDRTVCSAYSARPVRAATVSAPLAWEEVAEVEMDRFTILSMPARLAAVGELHAGIDDAACSLAPLLELVTRHEAEGLGDAPHPPHHPKGASEPRRVAPSRRATTGRRTSTMPLVTVAQAKQKDDVLAGLERWKARHPEAAARLEADDVLVDPMRGRSSMWYRVRINLRHVPEELRPPEEPPDPDYDPRVEWRRVR